MFITIEKASLTYQGNNNPSRPQSWMLRHEDTKNIFSLFAHRGLRSILPIE